MPGSTRHPDPELGSRLGGRDDTRTGVTLKTPLRFFSLEEANSVLPKLERLLEGLDHKKEAQAKLHDTILMEELLVQAGSSGAASDTVACDQEAKDLDEAVANLQKDLDEIRTLGCVVRNVEQGWIDFPTKRDGELIYFCWRRGEKTIRFFHSRKSGMTERVPLS